MKKKLLLILFIIFTLSCKKEQRPGPHGPKAVKRDIGAPKADRPVVKKTIGNSGGSVTSDDGTLILSVPAGALSQNTEISIQAVENTLEGSTGPSFRLLPENVVFSKPVEISFSFAGMDLDGTNPELLRLAYQTTEGYYYMPSTTAVDLNSKTLSTKTLHFSDWTVFECYGLSGPNSVLPNGTAELRLKTYVPLGPLTNNKDVMLGDYIESEDNDPILASAIWRLPGEGVINPKDKGCNYIAPASVPNQNPVTVSVQLTGDFMGSASGKTQKLILVQPIAIEGSENFTINLDGTSTRVTRGVFFSKGGALYISGIMNDKQFNIKVSANKVGNYPFRLPSAPNSADASLVTQTDFLDYLSTFRTACNENEPAFIFSPGHVEISKYPSQPGEFLQGIVSGATLFTGGNYCSNPKVVRLNASFKLLLR